uniref:NADH dehydrogenase subunit 2 n=1 Tax=Homoeocerus bipunctatus TaxID=3021836 RepID=UPI00237AD1D0|nr:NADH dehydrogenase subunit 2 [Homoeocerus bipunctatus]WBV80553.1 NADH dehydrogenase subunit 2 [Homoeocerus bipunctatus]
MKINSHKMLFLSIMILSSLITLSSNNWLSMWMGLEMNLMSFIPLISKSKNKKSSQAMMIYFMAQSIGSMTFLFSVLMSPLAFMSIDMISEVSKMMMMISVMIKLGAAPFHMWLPEMMANLVWYECMLLMTWQKIAPLIVMSNMYPNEWFLYMFVIMSAAVGGIGGVNQTSLRKIMAYSSINHLSWMMMFMSMNYSWYLYLIIYSMLIMMICIMFNNKNIYFISQLMNSSVSMMETSTFIMLFLSIGGLPPFLGFLPKWMVLQSMINSGLYMMMVAMLLLSLLPLFYYMRLMSSFVLSYSMMNKWFKTPHMNSMVLFMFVSVNLMLPVFMVMGFV